VLPLLLVLQAATVLPAIGSAAFSDDESVMTAASTDASAPTEPVKPVTLRWTTASEFERYGYHVYRARSTDGPFERLTIESLPAAGTTDVPQQYTFEDPNVEADQAYYYYVESVSTSNARERFTPVRRVVASRRQVAPPDAISTPPKP
jgi:hypothetical protein